ncbi:hypothetical protein [Methanothermobacter sp.]|uniref:hypothetical protein n=1 Tax=Methanothermobacter sp. TaxID=1884223 RepID=UPI0026373218|nr:hypothetical protein [Methanothermobacter sp.]MDI9618390.1 hypothetical protein [Methanothermobacter sp.]
MNSTKKGRLFAVLMIALVAYGFSSTVCIFIKPSFAVEFPTDILPSDEKIEPMGNPDFQPVILKKHIMNVTNNTTNETEVIFYTDNRTNRTAPASRDQNQDQ